MVCCKYNRECGFVVGATILMTCGWVLSCLAIATCNFAGIPTQELVTGELPVNEMGLFWFGTDGRLGTDGGCAIFEYNDLTANLPFWVSIQMNAARICGCLATFFAFIIMIFMWASMCCGCCHGKCGRVLWGILIILNMALFCGIFAVFGSSLCDEGCSVIGGAYCAIFAVVSYFFAAVVCFATKTKDDQDKKHKDAGGATSSKEAAGSGDVEDPASSGMPANIDSSEAPVTNEEQISGKA